MSIRQIFVCVLGQRAAALTATVSVLLGQACSGSDVVSIGGGGSAPVSSPTTETNPLQPGRGGVAPPAAAPKPASPDVKPPAPPEEPSPNRRGGGEPISGMAAEGIGGAGPLVPSAAGTSAAGTSAAGTSAAGNLPEPVAGGSTAPPAVKPSTPGVPSCAPAQGGLPALQLTSIVNGLDQPTFVAAAPGDERRLFVLERTGAIRVVRDGRLLAEPFLNLAAKVSTSNEEGLVGLAFHPSYAKNGRLFVQYSLLDPSRSEAENRQVVLSELVRSEGDPDHADPASERALMVVEQPSDIHLAGMLTFGPDGMLYISRGDGGSNDSQDLESWLGKLLRIDVDTREGDLPYGIPAGNMREGAASADILPEIWSYGWRNPWRFSFDSCTGDMYVGDVGESSFEEVNFEPARSPGRNYGWRTLEGPRCFDPAEACNTLGLTPPVLAYEHDFGCAITAGHVYRGQRIPGLRGAYLYADFCFGNFGSFRIEGGQPVDTRDITTNINVENVSLITSFGVDNAGELYVVSQLGGLYRIDPR